MTAYRVYLAGPDVFHPDAEALAEAKRKLCAEYGFIGISPVDNELGLEGLPPREAALNIALANEAAIRTCDLVIANFTPFRGPSADVGTAYEAGFARALGLRVFAYTNVAGSLLDRTLETSAGVTRRPSGAFEDRDGMVVENFGCFDNLMLFGALEGDAERVVTIEATAQDRFTALGGFEICLQTAKQQFGHRKRVARARR
jgi:nucleoside 2-deoxyribosyltransferase